ncbi:uncharacterized protein LOC142740479 [Rhinoderma darwinii]|uniref:uncharacterized protein LOC142740479 n=1 Tax=Rhinoderma darwinii TaxID=43563 RepID=UPI003F66E2F1
MAKIHVESVFRLLPVHPKSIRLLGCYWEVPYFVDGCLPRGCSILSTYFKAFSSFLEWVICEVAGVASLIHYLDDFLCVGLAGSLVCGNMLSTMEWVARRLGVPHAPDKTGGPWSILVFLRITIDSEHMACRLPPDKLEDVKLLWDWFRLLDLEARRKRSRLILTYGIWSAESESADLFFLGSGVNQRVASLFGSCASCGFRSSLWTLGRIIQVKELFSEGTKADVTRRIWRHQDSSVMVVNSTFLYNNVTQMSIFASKMNDIMKIVFLTLTIFCFCLYLYFMAVLLIVYFTTPHVRDNARYILFAHMLINDTLYLIVTLFLLFAHRFNVYNQVSICYFTLTLATTTFRVTPYNLAAMAFERYIAICFPLRHAILCTAKLTYSVMVVMWFVGLLPCVADFVVLIHSVGKDFFSQYVLCKPEWLIVQPVQNTLRSSTYIGSLLLVALVILFTYIKVMLVARKSGSAKSSASRAGRTLILHTFQLMLCMMSLTSSVTESYQGDYISILIMANFLFFMCLPRLLSPLIYGIRDEVFSKCIKKMYFIQVFNPKSYTLMLKGSLVPSPINCCPWQI